MFAPRLTIFSASSNIDSAIIVDTSITFGNGAVVTCSFVTNMVNDISIMTSNELNDALKEANKYSTVTKTLPRYEYPANVFTASSITATLGSDEDIIIRRSEAIPSDKLDSQRKANKGIYGSGYQTSVY